MDKQLKFSVFDQNVKVVPTFLEKETNKPFLNYGNNNQFPNYLWDLYLRSAILQSIINGTANYAVGNGIIYNEKLNIDVINKDGETLEDIINKITVDYLIFGGFAVQVIFNKLKEVSEIYWIDFRNVRLNREGNKIYYSDDWVRHANDYIVYDRFDPNNRKDTSIFYFKGHLSRGIYPIPRYNGALSAIETSTEISKFHLNSILNNFSGNFIINFNNGEPDDETKEIIEKKLKEKFSGADNAGKFITVYNDSKENAITVERIQDDSFDKKYDALRTSTFKEIFIAFRAIPQLFGFSLEGTGFNKQEFSEGFELFNKTVVAPIQRDIKNCIDKIFDLKDSIIINQFKLEEE